jgi:AcrR family transcriptional regulator
LRRDAARNRERILEAARLSFAQQGVDASLEHIAKTAGVAIGTLYRHFPKRVDLLLAAFEEKFGTFMAAAESALAAEDPWVGLSSYLEALCGMQAGDRGFNDFVSMRFPSSAETEAMHDQVCEAMERILGRAQNAKVARTDLTIGDLITVTWANSRIIEATTGIAPRAWRRQLMLTLESWRDPGEGGPG